MRRTFNGGAVNTSTKKLKTPPGDGGDRVIWSTDEYLAFAVVKMKVKPWEFWRITYREFFIMMLGYNDNIEEKTWIHSDLKAHIANCLVKKKDNTIWTADDFINKTVVVSKGKLTLKEAKQRLGSKFNLN